jgi:aflatoxin B1 aldehyde reductase
MYRQRYFKDSTFEALSLIEPVVKKHDLTLLETALRWVKHHSQLKINGVGEGGNDGIIIGVSSLKQLEGNVTDLEKGPLPDEVVQALDDAWNNVTKATSDTYWR